jgi:hypothetical protein
MGTVRLAKAGPHGTNVNIRMYRNRSGHGSTERLEGMGILRNPLQRASARDPISSRAVGDCRFASRENRACLSRKAFMWQPPTQDFKR